MKSTYICVGDHPPVVAYNKNDIKIVFHLGKDHPRPDVVVVAISVMSTNSVAVKAFTFQAAVPKVSRLLLLFIYYLSCKPTQILCHTISNYGFVNTQQLCKVAHQHAPL